MAVSYKRHLKLLIDKESYSVLAKEYSYVKSVHDCLMGILVF